MTCPKCRKEKLFEDPNPYHFSKIFDMPDHCPNCGQKFNLEPGFYYGAMYVSYGIGVAWLSTIYIAMMVLYPETTIPQYLLVGITSSILLIPYFFRLSRSIWIHLFVPYDKSTDK